MIRRKRGKVFGHQASSVLPIKGNKRWWLLSTSVLALLAIRIILSTLNANSDFANFVYLISFPFIALFLYLFEEPLSFTAKSGVAEVATLVALLFLFLASYVLINLFHKRK